VDLYGLVQGKTYTDTSRQWWRSIMENPISLPMMAWWFVSTTMNSDDALD
jgi:hypothetical protein